MTSLPGASYASSYSLPPTEEAEDLSEGLEIDEAIKRDRSTRVLLAKLRKLRRQHLLDLEVIRTAIHDLGYQK